MDYRDPPCAFCTTPRIDDCARCKAPLCLTHRLREPALWCVVCERERVDDIEFAVARAKLSSPAWSEHDEDLSKRFGPREGIGNLLSTVWHVATGPRRIRRARRAAMEAFPDKSLAEIASWRAANFRTET